MTDYIGCMDENVPITIVVVIFQLLVMNAQNITSPSSRTTNMVFVQRVEEVPCKRGRHRREGSSAYSQYDIPRAIIHVPHWHPMRRRVPPTSSDTLFLFENPFSGVDSTLQRRCTVIKERTVSDTWREQGGRNTAIRVVGVGACRHIGNQHH